MQIQSPKFNCNFQFRFVQVVWKNYFLFHSKYFPINFHKKVIRNFIFIATREYVEYKKQPFDTFESSCNAFVCMYVFAFVVAGTRSSVSLPCASPSPAYETDRCRFQNMRLIGECRSFPLRSSSTQPLSSKRVF